MDEFRYAIALAFLIGLPPGLLFWPCIHPWSAWRGFVCGPRRTAGHRVRDERCLSGAGRRVSERSRGGHPPTPQISDPACHDSDCPNCTLTAAQPCCRRDLYPDTTPALYGSVAVGAGFCVCGQLPDLVCLGGLSLPLLSVIVVLEERELRRRFGPAYTACCRRVPRFFRAGLERPCACSGRSNRCSLTVRPPGRDHTTRRRAA